MLTKWEINCFMFNKKKQQNILKFKAKGTSFVNQTYAAKI